MPTDGQSVLPTRRVLMICCAFPPTGGAGVQRSAKFAKYLPHFGWQPLIWSAEYLATLPRDDSLLNELPANLDHRASSKWDTSQWPDRAAAWVSGLTHSLDVNKSIARGLHWRADRWARMLTDALIPDGQALWALGSWDRLRRVIANERIDVIYSTHSPPSNHLLAWRLKKATRRPWVSDYRDLWTDDRWYPFANGPHWRLAADRFLENRFLRDADAVICTTQAQRDILAQRLTRQKDKCVTITNGVDLDDFKAVHRDSARRTCGFAENGDGSFVLAHVGRFTAERVRPTMVEGFAQFVEWLGPRKPRFELRVVGWVSDTIRRQFRSAGVAIRETGYVPHHRAILEMVAADALLLQYPDEPNADTAVSGKLFEYFAARRPVLAIAPPQSAARQLVIETGGGLGADPNVDSVADALKCLWHRRRDGALGDGCHPDHINRFSRRTLTAELSNILNRVRIPQAQDRPHPRLAFLR